jgi:hypothetical protein
MGEEYYISLMAGIRCITHQLLFRPKGFLILDNQAKSYGILNLVKRAFNLESAHHEIGSFDESNGNIIGIILSFFLILFNFYLGIFNFFLKINYLDLK